MDRRVVGWVSALALVAGCSNADARMAADQGRQRAALMADAQAVAEVYCPTRLSVVTDGVAALDTAFSSAGANDAVAAALVDYADGLVDMVDEVAGVEVVTPDAKEFVRTLGDVMTTRRAEIAELADAIRAKDPMSPRFARSTEAEIESLNRGVSVVVPGAAADFWSALSEELRSSDTCRPLAGAI